RHRDPRGRVVGRLAGAAGQGRQRGRMARDGPAHDRQPERVGGRRGRHTRRADEHHDGPGFPGPDRPGDRPHHRHRAKPREAAGA
ncbi:hypothetical protein LTR94_035818, partial [Friedmanniomyces endolithicus]